MNCLIRIWYIDSIWNPVVGKICCCEYLIPKREVLIPIRHFTLKPKIYHAVNFVVTGSTAGCHNDKLWYHQWRQSRHHDNFGVVMTDVNLFKHYVINIHLATDWATWLPGAHWTLLGGQLHAMSDWNPHLACQAQSHKRATRAVETSGQYIMDIILMLQQW